MLGSQRARRGKPNPLKNVYFGEQHLHTVNSPDAFAFGTRNTPDDAYRFCKGEAIKKQTTGEMVQKKTPYDWCALTDHAEYMGIMPLLLKKDNPLAGHRDRQDDRSGDPKKGEAAFQQIITSVANNKPISYMTDPKVMMSIWDEQKKITNKHNEPGKFTTLIAFEWTSIPQLPEPAPQRVLPRRQGAGHAVLLLRLGEARGSVDLSGGAARAWGTRTSRSRTTATSPTA